MARTRLTEVGELDENEVPAIGAAPPASVSRAHAERALSSLFMVTLKTLSQKTLLAFTALADLMLIGSAFALWYRAMAEPTVLQLVGLGGYSVFILVALWARNRSG